MSDETQDDGAAVVAPAADAAVEEAPEPTPVVVKLPSSASPTQQPESEPTEEKPSVSLEDAVGVLVALIKEHRTVGDGDLAVALDDVEAALAAKSE